jgi:hypothetical protein
MSSLGVLAALVSSIVSILLPLAVFAAQSPRWLPGSLWGSLAIISMILVAGLVAWFHESEDNERPLAVFISYSHADMDLRKELDKFLTPLESKGLIKLWNDDRVEPGDFWSPTIKEHLNASEIILLLVSIDFLNSNACRKERELSISLKERGLATVLPVILRPSPWEESLGRLQVLPKNGKPVTTWEDRDLAFLDIEQGVLRAIENRRNETRK